MEGKISGGKQEKWGFAGSLSSHNKLTNTKVKNSDFSIKGHLAGPIVTQ